MNLIALNNANFAKLCYKNPRDDDDFFAWRISKSSREKKDSKVMSFAHIKSVAQNPFIHLLKWPAAMQVDESENFLSVFL